MRERERELTYLVVPEGCEDEVHFDEDATEGQQAAEEGHDGRGEVPLARRDGPWDGLDAAGVVRHSRPVAADDGAWRPVKGRVRKRGSTLAAAVVVATSSEWARGAGSGEVLGR